MSADEEEAVLSEMAAQLEDIVAPDVEDVTQLSDLDLYNQLEDVRLALLNRREMLNPTTNEGRELHSKRAALLVEKNRRTKP